MKIKIKTPLSGTLEWDVPETILQQIESSNVSKEARETSADETASIATKLLGRFMVTLAFAILKSIRGDKKPLEALIKKTSEYEGIYRPHQ